MNKLAISNLESIIKYGYKYICLSYADLNQFLNIPWQKKIFYPVKDWSAHSKSGWFKTDNGMVMVWNSFGLEKDHIKISESHLPNDADNNKIWSDPLRFDEINSVEKIAKFMKLKVFW